MWRRVFRVRRKWLSLHSTASTSQKSSIGRQLRPFLDPYASRIAVRYGQSCPNPALSLANAFIEMPAFTVLSRLLLFAGVPLQEYEGWKRAVTTPNLDEALQHLQRMGVEFPGLRIEPDISGDISAGFSQPPTWLVLYLLCYRPSIRTDAQKLSMLASYHLSIAPPPLRPLLVILSAVQLARYNMTAPLTRLVDILLALPGELRAFHIDLLLQVLARSSWYTNATNLIITILEDSSVRHLRLSRRAFTAIFRLLASKHATARLGLSVERYMNLQGHVPALFQLKRLAELFARRRWNRKAARYLERIRELSLNRGSNIVSSGTNVIFVGKSMPHHSRSSTWYLSSFVTPEPLLRYMQRVAIMEEKGQNTSSTSSVDGGGVPESTANSRRSKRLFTTPQAWLSMLRVAASHKDTSAETLLQAFEQAQRQQFTPSTTFLIHVIVIKGLLRRGDVTNAVRLLDRIPHSERIRSTSVLTVVVETLTMANRGDEAYALLQEVAKPPSPSSSVSRSLVDIQTINTFMVSLHRIGRPDIVFELWDTMEAVFGIIPDNISLSILLKSARFARKCEGSVEGALMELGLGHLLYQRPVEVAVSLNVARQEANTRFQKLLGPDGPRKLSGLWKGQRAGVVALRIMRNVLLGNWPELQDVRSPVSALRQSATSQMVSPMKDLFRSVTGRMTHASVPLSEDNVPHYPRIVPSDITFRAYIDLLAEEELIPLIPLVLAWMQRLHIRPSRSTLATALVYWVEVSTDAPLVQKMKGGPLRSPYMKLRRWMSRWVGHHNMPMGEDIQVALRRIRFFREMGSYIMTPRRRK